MLMCLGGGGTLNRLKAGVRTAGSSFSFTKYVHLNYLRYSQHRYQLSGIKRTQFQQMVVQKELKKIYHYLLFKV